LGRRGGRRHREGGLIATPTPSLTVAPTATRLHNPSSTITKGTNTFMDQKSPSSNQNFPIDNLVYNLMMIITKKSKSLKAMDQYLQDAQNNERVKASFEKIRQQDEECVKELTRHLSFLIAQRQATGPGV
jgi:hypothetical protein